MFNAASRGPPIFLDNFSSVPHPFPQQGFVNATLDNQYEDMQTRKKVFYLYSSGENFLLYSFTDLFIYSFFNHLYKIIRIVRALSLVNSYI